MKHKLLPLFLIIVGCSGQQVFQVTANQGDGTQCVGTQNSSNTNFTFACVLPVKGQPAETHKIYNASSIQPKVSVLQMVGFGDVLCAFGVNPANYAATFGQMFQNVPPNSIAYSCSTTARDAGQVVGVQPGPMGTITWKLSAKRSFLARLFHLK